ncbi:NADPH-dependent diflavin oxidoreductase 1 [Galdieria sulphuraria]|nr:NADPH-dependent diflavin oxidoreductase 1 [Galdieria sulphuraria]
MRLLYATETGTAAELSQLVAEHFAKYISHLKVLELCDYDQTQLPLEDIVLFIISTTGDGEVPQDMRNFWRFLLLKNLPAHSLSQVQYAVFGLGDSSYLRFNAAARKLDKRLQHLGARPLLPIKLGDEQERNGLEGALQDWLVQLTDKLQLEENLYSECCSSQQFFWEAKVISNQLLVEEDCEHEVRQISLNIENSSITYKPGDVVYIYPKNSVAEVERLNDIAPVLNLSCPCTLESLVASQFDLYALPRRTFFRKLAKFAKDSEERDRLLYFSTSEGADDFRHCRPCIEDLIQFLPPLRPRPFSIASSPTYHSGTLQVCVSIVKYQDCFGFWRQGVCSSFLKRSKCGDVIPVFVKRGSLKFPQVTDKKPCIMIGPGTGVAPFRSYLWECFAHHRYIVTQDSCRILFFGCRYEQRDFLYKEEWEHLKQANILSQLHTAFSRDGAKKVYVQHRLCQTNAPRRSSSTGTSYFYF